MAWAGIGSSVVQNVVLFKIASQATGSATFRPIHLYYVRNAS